MTLRVLTTDPDEPYNQTLYEALAEQVAPAPAPPPGPDLAGQLAGADVLHVGWPEFWCGVDPVHTRAVVAAVRASGIRVVRTQHNLLPHRHKTHEAAICYQLWADVAHAVIHHSEWGQRVALATYAYGTATRHAVIPHGHWGHFYEALPPSVRTATEAVEGWAPCGLRLGVMGAPRLEKQLRTVLDAVASSARRDLQLVIRVDDGDSVPADHRIHAHTGKVPRPRYLAQLAACDALILPFAPTGMLTTGTAFDAIGRGLAVITSSWPFLAETFAGADIRYGDTVEGLRECIDSLTHSALSRSSAAVAALRPRYEWGAIAESTLDLIQAVMH